ncbi:DUF2231 domain-containing protein [Dactylosporangium sp. NPDC048998]|uniref:DUF2231 domain-containing protein n=1 Tax=Dactylosporangium sp. NPDC048998 TaxID=3363976 RepID=UPI0037136A05
MTTVNGLPAHVLLVHAIVVLLPLSALLLVLTAAWPAARRRLAGANLVLSAATLVLTPVTTDAGEWLERRVPSSAVLRDHTELGDTAVWAALAVTAMALAIWWRQREAGGRRTLLSRRVLAPQSAVVTATITAVAVVVAGLAVADIYRIGDSGAKAAWEGRLSSTPAERQAPPHR